LFDAPQKETTGVLTMNGHPARADVVLQLGLRDIVSFELAFTNPGSDSGRIKVAQGRSPACRLFGSLRAALAAPPQSRSFDGLAQAGEKAQQKTARWAGSTARGASDMATASAMW
jgi:hypothetical protein